MNAFDRLHPALQHHIVNSLGWQELRPVQSLSIEACLAGANMVILAPTAGGKTEAAAARTALPPRSKRQAACRCLSVVEGFRKRGSEERPAAAGPVGVAS